MDKAIIVITSGSGIGLELLNRPIRIQYDVAKEFAINDQVELVVDYEYAPWVMEQPNLPDTTIKYLDIKITHRIWGFTGLCVSAEVAQ